MPTGVPAAMEPAAAVVAASATESATVERERPVLTDGSAAASREYWVLNAAVEPKVILKKALGGPESLGQGRNSLRRPGGRHVRQRTHQ